MCFLDSTSSKRALDPPLFTATCWCCRCSLHYMPSGSFHHLVPLPSDPETTKTDKLPLRASQNGSDIMALRNAHRLQHAG